MKTSCDNDSCCDTATACGDQNESCAANCLEAVGCECPVEKMTGMWAGSFGEAMKQAQTEVLKSKILKAWGPMLDQTADKLIETMGAVWAVKSAEVKAAQAKQAFQANLRDVLLQEKKK